MNTKTILVLGATGYVGKAISKNLVSLGYSVILHGRDNKKLENLAKSLGSKCLGSILFDFEKNNINLFKINLQIYGIVNTVAISGPVNSFNIDDWVRTITINTIIPFGLLLNLSKQLAKGGRIINFSSALTGSINHKGYIGQDAYIISKAALNSVSMILNHKLKGEFRINVIAPGYIKNSNFRDNFIQNDNINSLLKRNCYIEDIIGLVDFLLSSNSDFITGEIFFLDGKRKY